MQLGYATYQYISDHPMIILYKSKTTNEHSLSLSPYLSIIYFCARSVSIVHTAPNINMFNDIVGLLD